MRQSEPWGAIAVPMVNDVSIVLFFIGRLVCRVIRSRTIPSVQKIYISVSQKMKVLRYDWPTDSMFLLDMLINPAKL